MFVGGLSLTETSFFWLTPTTTIGTPIAHISPGPGYKVEDAADKYTHLFSTPHNSYLRTSFSSNPQEHLNMVLSYVDGALVLIAGAIVFTVLKVLRTVIRRYLSPLRYLRGPPPNGLIYGNIMQMGPDHMELNRQWVKQYGTSFRGTGLFLVSISIASCQRKLERP